MIDRTEPDALVELANMILHVARKLRDYPLKHPEVAPLSPLECLVLLHVHGAPGVTPSRLSAELSLSSSNTATAIRGLVDKGQLERRRDPEDKRSVHLRTTPSAQRSIRIVQQQYHDLLAAVGVPDDDIAVTVRTLTVIHSQISET